jgi:hypothetical protein
VLITATATGGGSAIALPDIDSMNLAWFGPEPPGWLGAGATSAGRIVLPATGGRCSPERLYAGLHGLFITAWSRHAPEKAAIVQRHLANAADTVGEVLQDQRLMTGLKEIAESNARYRTAFFISPFASSGRVWEEQFDVTNRLLMVHHLPGQSAYGPIVTIDCQVDQKYLPLENRAAMLARHGEPSVTRWEAQHCEGRSLDDFVSRPPQMPILRPKAPFVADNRWYLPTLRPGYDTRRDNLIFLDMTGERHLPVMLDELALLGSRIPRLVVMTQEERIQEIGEKTLFSFPVCGLLALPSIGGAPISDLHLPFVLNAVGIALSDTWRRLPDTG